MPQDFALFSIFSSFISRAVFKIFFSSSCGHHHHGLFYKLEEVKKIGFFFSGLLLVS